MTSGFLKLTASVLLLTASAVASYAQEGPDSMQGEGPMMQQDHPDMMLQQQDDDSAGMQQPAREVYPDWHGKRMGKGDRGWRDRDADRMRAHMGPGMMRMMVILMDADGDGALSLEEVQAVHARIFKAIDADNNNRATLEEIRSFFSSMRGR